MNFTHISSIKVLPNRQRKEFDETALQELISSIRDSTYGLLHPPVVRTTTEGHFLVAGERRLRAIAEIYELGGRLRYNGDTLPAGMVPYNSLGDLSPLDAMEAELEENVRRADLTWAERAAATTRLMEFRQAQAKDAGTSPPTVAAISQEVRGSSAGGFQDATKKELIVAQHLHDPEVAAAPTLNEAFKILKKKEVAAQNTALAAQIGATYSSSVHSLINGDSKEELALFGNESFQIILSDPPYGMGADEFGDSGPGAGAGAHFYKDDYETWASIMDWFAPESFRLAAPEAHMYLFCDIDRFEELRYLVRKAGWTPFRTPLIWHNPDGFRAPWPDKGPQRKYELILFAVKGGKTTNHLAGDVIECRRDTALGHPAQKPVELLTNLLRRSAKPGDKVLDPFAGSGSTLAAANELKLSCCAIEKDPAAYAIAAKRLAALDQQPGLF